MTAFPELAEKLQVAVVLEWLSVMAELVDASVQLVAIVCLTAEGAAQPAALVAA